MPTHLAHLPSQSQNYSARLFRQTTVPNGDGQAFQLATRSTIDGKRDAVVRKGKRNPLV